MCQASFPCEELFLSSGRQDMEKIKPQFQVTIRNRNISKEDIIIDLQNIAKELNNLIKIQLPVLNMMKKANLVKQPF